MDKAICIGKNYLDHEKEMGDPKSESITLFLKPPSSVLHSSETQQISLDQRHGDIHYECEVVLQVSKKIDFKSSPQDKSLDSISKIGLGLDLTKRKLQSDLKNQKKPWEVSKSFYGSAFLFPLLDFEKSRKKIEDPFFFFLNGEKKQEGLIQNMKYPLETLLSEISEYFTLMPGDLIFTGTPSGVGPLKHGDQIKVEWGGDYLYETSCKDLNL